MNIVRSVCIDDFYFTVNILTATFHAGQDATVRHQTTKFLHRYLITPLKEIYTGIMKPKMVKILCKYFVCE